MQAATAAFPAFSFQVGDRVRAARMVCARRSGDRGERVAVIAAVSSARFVMCVIAPR